MGWISVKDRLPPYDEFVEVYMEDTTYRRLKREFCAYVEIDGVSMWTSSGMCEDEWSDEGFKITHWKKMSPDPNGERPYVRKIRKGGDYNSLDAYSK